MKKRIIKMSSKEWAGMMRVAESEYIPELEGIDVRGSGGKKANDLIFDRMGYKVGDKVKSIQYVTDSPFEVIAVNENKTLDLVSMVSHRLMSNVQLWWRNRINKVEVAWEKVKTE